jgi:hypothetical protein
VERRAGVTGFMPELYVYEYTASRGQPVDAEQLSGGFSVQNIPHSPTYPAESAGGTLRYAFRESRMINWEELAKEVGAIKNGQESGSNIFAQRAIELLIGPDNIREAVNYYINGGPGAELARCVIWQIHPISAMEYCYEIYKTDENFENRRMAVELLRVAADRRVLPWVPELLTDSDPGIRAWGFGIIDQLLWSNLVEEEEVEHLINLAQANSDEHLKENIEFVKGFLRARKERADILERHKGKNA